MNVLEQLGIKKKEKSSFPKLLFYFLRECHINPLDVHYEVIPIYQEKRFWFFKWKKLLKYKITQNGITTPLFNSLLTEMQEHYKKEAEQYKKLSRRR